MIRRRRTLFIVDGGLAVLLGAGLLLAPVQLLLAFGVTIGPAPSVVTRLLGAAVLSHGAVLILTRNHVDGAVGTALIRGHLVFDVLGLAISAYATAAGLVNSLGWGLAVLFLVAALARVRLLREGRPAVGTASG